MRVEGLSRWQQAKAKGCGVLVATAHTGNWDLAACRAAELAELVIVSKRLSARGLDAFWQETRRARGATIVVPEGGGVVREVARALARGQSVAVLIDQDPERTQSVIAHDFLGESAAHDRALATLSARTGAPIVVAFARRERRSHVLSVVDVIEPPQRPSSEWIDQTTRRVSDALETFVRAHPTEWLWLHRRWKTRLPKPHAKAARP